MHVELQGGRTLHQTPSASPSRGARERVAPRSSDRGQSPLGRSSLHGRSCSCAWEKPAPHTPRLLAHVHRHTCNAHTTQAHTHSTSSSVVPSSATVTGGSSMCASCRIVRVGRFPPRDAPAGGLSPLVQNFELVCDGGPGGVVETVPSASSQSVVKINIHTLFLLLLRVALRLFL